MGQILPLTLFTFRSVPKNSQGTSPLNSSMDETHEDYLTLSRRCGNPKESSLQHTPLSAGKLPKSIGGTRPSSQLAGDHQSDIEELRQNHQGQKLPGGDLVMVVLPSTTNKLLAKWQGPFLIVD